jgi:hypothetical protein
MPRLVLTLLLAVSTIQASGSRFLGAWVAEFEGRTFVRLELTESKGILGGKIALGNIHVDEAGKVDAAESAPRS